MTTELFECFEDEYSKEYSRKASTDDENPATNDYDPVLLGEEAYAGATFSPRRYDMPHRLPVTARGFFQRILAVRYFQTYSIRNTPTLTQNLKTKASWERLAKQEHRDNYLKDILSPPCFEVYSLLAARVHKTGNLIMSQRTISDWLALCGFRNSPRTVQRLLNKLRSAGVLRTWRTCVGNAYVLYATGSKEIDLQESAHRPSIFATQNTTQTFGRSYLLYQEKESSDTPVVGDTTTPSPTLVKEDTMRQNEKSTKDTEMIEEIDESKKTPDSMEEVDQLEKVDQLENDGPLPLPTEARLLCPDFADFLDRGPKSPDHHMPTPDPVIVHYDKENMTEDQVALRKQVLVDFYLMPTVLAEVHARIENMSCDTPLLTPERLEKELAAVRWNFTAEEIRRLSTAPPTHQDIFRQEFLKQKNPGQRQEEARAYRTRELKETYRILSERERMNIGSKYTFDPFHPVMLSQLAHWEARRQILVEGYEKSAVLVNGYLIEEPPVSLNLDYCLRQARIMRDRDFVKNPGGWPERRYRRALAATVVGAYYLKAHASGLEISEFRGVAITSPYVERVQGAITACAEAGGHAYHLEAQTWLEAMTGFFDLRRQRVLQHTIGAILSETGTVRTYLPTALRLSRRGMP